MSRTQSIQPALSTRYRQLCPFTPGPPPVVRSTDTRIESNESFVARLKIRIADISDETSLDLRLPFDRLNDPSPFSGVGSRSTGDWAIIYVCPNRERLKLGGSPEEDVGPQASPDVIAPVARILSPKEACHGIAQSLESFRKRWDDYKTERARRMTAFEEEDSTSDL